MPNTTSVRHLTISLEKINRARRKSFADSVAYILRGRAQNPRTERISDYRGKGGLLAGGVVGWSSTLKHLVREAVLSERRRDAVEGRALIVALPREFGRATCVELLTQLANYLAEKFRVAVVYALHAPDPEGDQRNRHGHLVFSAREVGMDGCSLGKKTREWDTAAGRAHTEALRAWWASQLNATLALEGHEPNIEHRSLARLGVRRAPGRHHGPARTAIRRRERVRQMVEDRMGIGRPPRCVPAPKVRPEPPMDFVPAPRMRGEDIPIWRRPVPRPRIPEINPQEQSRGR